MTVAITAIPVSADGSVELLAGPIELDKLDLLFKAQVDVGGIPGQVHEGQISFTSHLATLDCVVEEVESGELIDFQCRAPIAIPKDVPKAGGPKPIPSDDAELDWEDDDTLEAMLGEPSSTAEISFKDSGLDESDTTETLAADAPKEKGLDALLKALLTSDGPKLDTPPAASAASAAPASEDALESDDGLSGMGADSLFSALLGGALTDEPEDLDPANAKGLLSLMVESGDLELEDDADLDDLVPGAAPIVASPRPSSAKAVALSEWLFEQDGVAELYMDDESLASLLEQW